MMQKINPVSHIERWGFVVLMKLPILPRWARSSLRYDKLRGIKAELRRSHSKVEMISGINPPSL